MRANAIALRPKSKVATMEVTIRLSVLTLERQAE